MLLFAKFIYLLILYLPPKFFCCNRRTWYKARDH